MSLPIDPDEVLFTPEGEEYQRDRKRRRLSARIDEYEDDRYGVFILQPGDTFTA